MLRAMYSGISGMSVNQTKLDIVGNNIANVGTTAFKSSRVRFQDMLSQNESEALGPGRTQGGVNPKQVGLGVQIGGIDTITTQGMMQPTGRNLDVGLDGSGYFMVVKSPVQFDKGIGVKTEEHILDEDSVSADVDNMDIMYTRDGAFTLDSDGNLLTPDGFRVLGYDFDQNLQVDDTNENRGKVTYVNADKADLEANGEILKTLVIPDAIETEDGMLRVRSFSIEKDGTVRAVLSDGRVAAIGQIAMASFKNAAGLSRTGKNIFKRTANSGQAIIRSAYGVDSANDNGNGYGDMLQGMLEMSNVDLTEQFTDMIVANRAFQASGKMITTGDEILQNIINLKR